MDIRLVILAFGMLAGATDGAVIGSLLPAIAADTGVSVAQAGLVVFAHAVTFAIGAPVLAALLGGRDRRRVLAGAATVVAAGALTIAVFEGLTTVIGGRVVLALGSALFGTMATATAVALSPPERRGRSLAIVITGQSLGGVIGAPVAAWIAVNYDWRLVYFGIAAWALLTAAAMIAMMPKGLIGEVRTIRERLAVLGAPGLPLALLITFIVALGCFMVTAYFLPITVGMGLGRTFQPWAVLAYGIGSVMGNQVGGLLVDRLGPKRTLAVFTISQVVLYLGLPVVAGLPGDTVAPVYLIQMMLAGATAWGLHTAILANISALVPASVSLAMSLNATALNIGMALAAILGGIVLERIGVLEIGVAGAAITAVALIAISFLRPRAA